MERNKEGKIQGEMNDLRAKFRRFCKAYENLHEKSRIQELAIEENTKFMLEFQVLKRDFDQMKERLNVAETQNFDKDVKIGELKNQLEKLSKEKEVKLSQLQSEVDKLRQEKSAILLELKELKFQQKRIALVPPMAAPSPKKAKIEVSKGSSKVLENNNEPKTAKSVKRVKFNLVDEAQNESNDNDVKNVTEEKSPPNRRAGLKSTSSLIGIPSLESLMGFGNGGNTGNGSPLNSISNNAKKMHSLKSILKTRNSVKEEESTTTKKIDEKNDDANEDDVACKGDSPKQPFLWSVADPTLRNQGDKRI